MSQGNYNGTPLHVFLTNDFDSYHDLQFGNHNNNESDDSQRGHTSGRYVRDPLLQDSQFVGDASDEMEFFSPQPTMRADQGLVPSMTSNVEGNEGNGIAGMQLGDPDSINTDDEENLLQGIGAALHPGFNLSQNSLGLGDLNSQDFELSASGEGPLGCETICFDEYPGNYGFEVSVTPTGKSIYNRETKDLFCMIGTYAFEIKLNFGMIHNLDGYTVRAALVYKDPTHQNKPVTKCRNCVDFANNLSSGSDEENTPANSLKHIMRGHQEDVLVSYSQSEQTKFLYTMINLRRPEPGSKCLEQRLAFTCRSSCSSKDGQGINRRTTFIVFTLLDSLKQVIGRSAMELRICSAPLRDYKQKYGENHYGTVKAEGKRKPTKKQVGQSPIATIVSPDQKIKRELGNSPVAAAPEAVASSSSAPAPVAGCSTDRRNSRMALVDESDLDDSELLSSQDQEESSQESTYELPNSQPMGPEEKKKLGIKLGKLMKRSRTVLARLRSTDGIKKGAAVQLMQALVHCDSVCTVSRRLIRYVNEKEKLQRQWMKKESD